MRDRISGIGAEVSRCDASAINLPRGIPEEPGDSAPSELGAAPSHGLSTSTSIRCSELGSVQRHAQLESRLGMSSHSGCEERPGFRASERDDRVSWVE